MWLDPFTVFGAISTPMLVSNLATVIGFFLATYFALKYTKLFYEGRPKPKSWLLIVGGLSFITISEIAQFLILYRINPIVLEAMIILITQSIGILLIACGSLLLSREVV